MATSRSKSQLRAASSEGASFQSTKLWGDDWFFEYGMGNSGVGLSRTHHTQKSIFIATAKGRIFDTIAEAIAYATDGDTIAVEPGSYKEGSLKISKKICLVAGDGSGDIYHGIRLSQDEVEAPGCYTSVSVDGQLKSPLVTCVFNAGDTYLCGNSSCTLWFAFLRNSDIEQQAEESVKVTSSKKVNKPE